MFIFIDSWTDSSESCYAGITCSDLWFIIDCVTAGEYISRSCQLLESRAHKAEAWARIHRLELRLFLLMSPYHRLMLCTF